MIRPLNPAKGPVVMSVLGMAIGLPVCGPGPGSGVKVMAYPEPTAPPGEVNWKPGIVGGVLSMTSMSPTLGLKSTAKRAARLAVSFSSPACAAA